MSPRNSQTAAAETRHRVVGEAVDRSSVEGLEGITIGKLATSLGMSKAGVIGIFGDKEQLQLAAIEEAIAIYRREIWDKVSFEPAGIERLRAVGEAWMSYLERDVFPGGCFLTAAAAEFDGRPGRVREAVEGALSLWGSVLEADAAKAIEAGDLDASTGPAQVAFEMNAIAMAVNQARQLRGDDAAGDRGRQALARLLASPA